ncbi:MAG: hypothetical protein ACTSR8_15375 [Promethearchaeota archaeon]
MAIPRHLTVVFTGFYVAVIIYMFLFLSIPEVQISIMAFRQGLASSTEESQYYWTILIVIGICFLGNASIGFPIPYPFILFSFSNSIFLRYSSQGLEFSAVLMSGGFWLEIVGLALAGGFGSALGEFTSYLLGKGAKIITEKTDSESKLLINVGGFGRLVLEHPNRLYLYIFGAAATPIPDDPLWIAMGMSDHKINLAFCLIFGWIGKNIITIFYVILPILIRFGFTYANIELNDVNSVISEGIILLATLSIMFFILAFDWNKYIQNKQNESHQELQKENKD